MPYYPYRCLNCKKRFEVFMTYSEYGVNPVSCPHCASQEVQRRINRVRIARSDDSRLDDMSDLDSLEGLEDDPKTLGRMMRKMSSEVGEDMGPELGEVIDRLEAGQSPDEIESAMPEMGGPDDESGLGGGMGGGGDFDM